MTASQHDSTQACKKAYTQAGKPTNKQSCNPDNKPARWQAFLTARQQANKQAWWQARQSVGWLAGRLERFHSAYAPHREDACPLFAWARLRDLPPPTARLAGPWQGGWRAWGRGRCPSRGRAGKERHDGDRRARGSRNRVPRGLSGAARPAAAQKKGRWCTGPWWVSWRAERRCYHQYPLFSVWTMSFARSSASLASSVSGSSQNRMLRTKRS